MRTSVALAVVAGLTLWGCGNSGSHADASAPDGAQAIDAAPVTDSGHGGNGDAGAPYQLVTCQAGDAGSAAADAGPLPDAATVDAATVDAAPQQDAAATGDGGAPPGTGNPCCTPDMQCSAGLACIEEPGGGRTCRPLCDLKSGACPPGGLCANFGGQGVCIPASTEGQPCDPELCDSRTICIGTSPDNAVCRRRCSKPSDCPSGQTCTAIQGSSDMACLPN